MSRDARALIAAVGVLIVGAVIAVGAVAWAHHRQVEDRAALFRDRSYQYGLRLGESLNVSGDTVGAVYRNCTRMLANR
jgi:hypothetical protein